MSDMYSKFNRTTPECMCPICARVFRTDCVGVAHECGRCGDVGLDCCFTLVEGFKECDSCAVERDPTLDPAYDPRDEVEQQEELDNDDNGQ